jgi:hypothetical protein
MAAAEERRSTVSSVKSFSQSLAMRISATNSALCRAARHETHSATALHVIKVSPEAPKPKPQTLTRIPVYVHGHCASNAHTSARAHTRPRHELAGVLVLYRLLLVACSPLDRV